MRCRRRAAQHRYVWYAVIEMGCGAQRRRFPASWSLAGWRMVDWRLKNEDVGLLFGARQGKSYLLNISTTSHRARKIRSVSTGQTTTTSTEVNRLVSRRAPPRTSHHHL